jgi:hypothetical protein
MILVNSYRFGFPYEPESIAIFAAMTTPPSDTRKGDINTCVLALKAAGAWTRLEFLWMLAAADQQAGFINWITPANSLTETEAGGTFTADRGYNSNGAASGYLTGPTQYFNMTKYGQNDGHVAIWSRTVGQQANATMGCASVATVLLRPRNTSDQAGWRVNNTAATSAVANADGTGFFMADRIAAGTEVLHRNGAQIGTAATASNTRPAATPSIGRSNAAYSTVQVACAAVGASCADISAAYYAAIAGYMTAVGA